MAKQEDKNLTELFILNKFKNILKYSKEEIFNDLSQTEPKIDIVNVINISKYDKCIEATKTIGLIISFALLGLMEVQGILFSIGNLPISDTSLGYIILTAIIITIATLIVDEINKLRGISKYQNNALEYIKESYPELINRIQDPKCKKN